MSAEDDLIIRHFRPLAHSPGALGLVDDAAFLPAADEDIVITTDAVVAGVHFFAEDAPATVARKALRVNLSDLAAKGAEPAGFVMTLALPSADHAWLTDFAAALGEDSTAFACPLVGGDTVATPGPLSVSITAFGRVPSGRMVKRSGAGVGEAVYVTGTIGDAAAGLWLRRHEEGPPSLPGDQRAHLLDRYAVPRPRNALAVALRDHATAAIDVSDGLAGDLGKLCAASSIMAEIDVARVPLSDAAQALVAGEAGPTLALLISGGDDYEIAFTARVGHEAMLERAAMIAGVPVTRIGRTMSGNGLARFLDHSGRPMTFAASSYSHF